VDDVPEDDVLHLLQPVLVLEGGRVTSSTYIIHISTIHRKFLFNVTTNKTELAP
jgi:hypothetical protein